MRQISFISLVSAVALVSGCGTNARLEEARRETARVQLHTLEMAAELAYMKAGRYPDSLAGLDVERRDDPWGHAFVYALSGTGGAATLTLSSLGPDGVAGNADDVRLQKEKKP